MYHVEYIPLLDRGLTLRGGVDETGSVGLDVGVSFIIGNEDYLSISIF